MAYPSTISTLANPAPTDRLNSPSHSTLHDNENSAIVEIQTFVGTLPSSAVGTLIYDIRSPDSNGGGHVQTANKGGTGQTGYMKGDLLVAQSASVLAKLAIGSDGQGLVVDSNSPVGVSWGSPGTAVTSTVAVSSVWTKPTNIAATSKVFVQLWGGGGSGGIAAGGNEAAGGGGGGYKEGWFQAAQLPSSVLVQVGVGGDSVSSSNSGQPGKITVFGVQSSLLTAYAGGGGEQASSNPRGGGGGGLLASGSDGAAGGIVGGGVTVASVFGGTGGIGNSSVGAAVYGGGGVGVANATSPGSPSYAIYGGGGGGGVGSSVVTAGSFSQLGGSGSAGSIIGAAVASVQAGSIPGGGGGAAFGGSGSSGQGGMGKAIITVFF